MFSTLRAKIFAGYLVILLLLAGVGAYAIFSIRSLNETTSSGLELNAQTTLANLSMYGSLSRINEGLLSALNEPVATADSVIATQSQMFYGSLQSMQRFLEHSPNAAISETLTRIEIAWQQYEALLQTFATTTDQVEA